MNTYVVLLEFDMTAHVIAVTSILDAAIRIANQAIFDDIPDNFDCLKLTITVKGKNGNYGCCISHHTTVFCTVVLCKLDSFIY